MVTGGMGFIGSNFIRYWLQRHPQDTLLNLDLLTYAGREENLADVSRDPRYALSVGDIADPMVIRLLEEEKIDTIVHFAAESHVDQSILDPQRFVRTNVLGTQNLLEAARRSGVRKFVHISTDEVYGTLGSTGKFTEDTPLAPNSPYSASKAGSDLLVRAYCETYGFPAVITRCSNNYGPYQFPEKLIPTIITRALRGEDIPVYGDGLYVRDWLHVEDHCSGIERVLLQGRQGEVYNIGGGNERTNMSMVRFILEELGRPLSLIRHVEDRLGHDRRYAIDSSKIRRELGWAPVRSLEEGLKTTVQWYVEHRDWWEPLLAGGGR